jgi:trehalose 6-phosphate phosphatase
MLTAPKHVDCETTALFLDVDGTLLDIQDHPGDVRADPELVELLQQLLTHFNGALALISGRSIAEIDRIFGNVHFPAVGAHGAEMREVNSVLEAAPSRPLPANVLQRITRLVDDHDGLLLERKKGGVSLHYRRAPELAAKCKALVLEVMPELGSDFRLIEGKMVYEIAPRQHNKGEAIRQLLKSREFKQRQPVFIGDDITDEDGFEVVNALQGISIRVGAGSATAAQFALGSVADVREWLHSVVAASRGNNKSWRTSVDES